MPPHDRTHSTFLAALAIALLMAAGGHTAAPPLRRTGQLDAVSREQIFRLHQGLQRAIAAGRFEEAEQQARQILALRERRQGKGHWESIDARLDVQRWQRLTRVAARDRSEVARALALRDEGDRLLDRERFTEAEARQRSALAILRKVLGQKHRETARSCIGVAATLHARGQDARAQPLLEEALAICREALGEQHADTASAFNNLAACFQAQGKHNLARPRYQKALAMQRQVQGEEHPLTATAYQNVAMNLVYLGKHTQAQPHLEKALAICRRVLGEEHVGTALAYLNMGMHLSDQGLHVPAQPLLEKALAICRKKLGEPHSYTATSYTNVASNLDDQGKHALAQPLYEQALAIRRGVFGEKDPATAIAYNNLATCLLAQGKYARAQPLYEKALAIHRLLGEEHPGTALCYFNLASCLSAQHRHPQALPLLKKSLAIYRKVLGEDHPDTARSLVGLADNFSAQGQHARAQPLYEQALAIRRQALGEDHPATARCYNDLGICLGDQGQDARGQPLLEKALAIRRRTLGEDHPDTASSANNLAYNLYDQGKLAEAVRLWQASLPGQEAARFHTAGSGFDRAVATATKASPRAALTVGLVRLGQPCNAFRHAEASLARALLDDLASSGQDEARALARGSGQLRALDARLLPLLGRGDLGEDQRLLRGELIARRRGLLTDLTRLAAAVSARQVLPLERIQEQLPADAALILWIGVPGMGPPLGCVVRREGPPVWVPLPGSGKDGAWIDADLRLAGHLHRALRNPASAGPERERLVAAVRAQRLEPLRPHLRARGRLPAVRHLFVIPTSVMALVPFELLAPGYSVSYIPSGSVLARTLQAHRPLRAENLLALGNPVFAPPPGQRHEPPRQGLLLAAVLPGSAAARAGLQAGDVLLSYGAVPLGTLDDLTRAQAGGPGRLRYWRDGKQGRTAILPAGRLGVSIDPLPVREALKRWREQNTAVSLRGTGHPPLPGSAHEVEALAALVPQTTKLLGSQASEQELDRLLASGQLKRYRLLHFATHGEVDRADPDRSCLILAQDRLPDPFRLLPGQKAYSGELTVKTIRTTWQLDADLVVLSACRTGLGQFAVGEGLLGFAHAFLARGARSVVLSRWKVDDTATALLMGRFYENLLGKRKGLKQPLGRAEALDEARRWLRTVDRKRAAALAGNLERGTLRGSEVEVPALAEKAPALPAGDRPYAHPYYWAAFVLLGDPD
jgi:tetratricopeptide (TPR) repeat protein